MGMSEQIEQTTLRIASLPGDGIGPEVNAEALKVLSAAVEAEGVKLDVAEQLIGGHAIDATGSPLPERTLDAVRSAEDRKSTRLNSSHVAHLVCRPLLA